MEDKQMAPDSDWELVDKPGPPGEQPDAVEPPVSPQPAPAAPESPARNPKVRLINTNASWGVQEAAGGGASACCRRRLLASLRADHATRGCFTLANASVIDAVLHAGSHGKQPKPQRSHCNRRSAVMLRTPQRTPMPPRSLQHAEPEPPGLLEEIAAKGLFCLLCVVEAAVKMTAHATQVGNRAPAGYAACLKASRGVVGHRGTLRRVA